MLSTLFGKKATKSNTNPPWDTVVVGAISVPIWRSSTRDGQSRFVFGISRPFKNGGKELYAKTFGVEHLWDIARSLQEFALLLGSRRDVPRSDRVIIEQFIAALERALEARQVTPVKFAGGRSEPTR